MKCDKCRKKATYNVQMNVYEEVYTIDKEDGYRKVTSDFIETEEGENKHLCDKHFKEME